jgi:flagellin
MGLRINQNVAANNAHRNLTNTDNALSKSLERLSSGLRINRAADDAAGLSISEKMSAQVNGLNQASANAQDGISLIQTAEGALSESSSILQRMRDLAVQASNGTLQDSDRTAVSNEVNQLKTELDRIVTSTKYNNQALLNGALGAAISTTGLAAGGGFSNVETIGAASGTYTLTWTASGTQLTISGAGGTETQAVTAPTGYNTTAVTFNSVGVRVSLNAAIGSSASGTGSISVGTGNLTLHVGANNGETIGVSISNMSSSTLGLGSINTGTQAGAEAAIASLDTAISQVASTRGTLGGIQNRLEHTISNLGVTQENVAASESRIRDVDMAAEMTSFTRNQIMMQAGTAMLAQANAVPQTVLQLLK